MKFDMPVVLEQVNIYNFVAGIFLKKPTINNFTKFFSWDIPDYWKPSRSEKPDMLSEWNILRLLKGNLQFYWAIVVLIKKIIISRIFFTDIDVYWINEKSISEEPPPKKLVESFLKVSEWNETIMPLEHLKFSWEKILKRFWKNIDKIFKR